MSTATDDAYTADLVAIADELLAADPPNEHEADVLALVRPSPSEASKAEDAEDAALLRASTHLRDAAKIGGRYSARDYMPEDPSWRDQAECGEAPPEDQDAFTQSRSQAEATRVIAEYCAGCPVAADCLTEGRTTRGWGTFGGVVLLDGRRAPEHRPGTQPATGSGNAAAQAAQSWLTIYLTEQGPTQRADVLADAVEAGHPRQRIERAAAHLSVSSRRTGVTVEWSLPEIERATEQAVQGAELWLIDWLDAHGSTDRADVLAAAPYSHAAMLGGAARLDLDPEADAWALP